MRGVESLPFQAVRPIGDLGKLGGREAEVTGIRGGFTNGEKGMETGQSAELAADAGKKVGADEDVNEIETAGFLVTVGAAMADDEDMAGLKRMAKAACDVGAGAGENDGDLVELVAVLRHGKLVGLSVHENAEVPIVKVIAPLKGRNRHGGIVLIIGGIIKVSAFRACHF